MDKKIYGHRDRVTDAGRVRAVSLAKRRCEDQPRELYSTATNKQNTEEFLVQAIKSCGADRGY